VRLLTIAVVDDLVALVVIATVYRPYAAEVGPDLERFADDLDRHRHADRIAEDVASADASGVADTPSFFINGKRYDGAYDLAPLSAAVRAAAITAVNGRGA
jgi:predicted DsbA family dithiol-disulfide isomerase